MIRPKLFPYDGIIISVKDLDARLYLKEQYLLDKKEINKLGDKANRIRNIKRKNEFIKAIKKLEWKWEKLKDVASGPPPILEDYHKLAREGMDELAERAIQCISYKIDLDIYEQAREIFYENTHLWK